MKISCWCTPSAIFTATAFHIKGYQVRMIVQKLREGVDHVQAEALIDGVWTPLTEIWDNVSMAVITYQRHYPDIEPYRIVGLDTFFNEQYRMFKKR